MPAVFNGKEWQSIVTRQIPEVIVGCRQKKQSTRLETACHVFHKLLVVDDVLDSLAADYYVVGFVVFSELIETPNIAYLEFRCGCTAQQGPLSGYPLVPFVPTEARCTITTL